MPICARAIGQIDGLIQAQPNNPYFYELKGQALLEGGKPAEAIAPLHRAIQLAPQPGADPGPAGAGAQRHRTRPSRADEAVTLLRTALAQRARIGRRLHCSSPWPTAARAISPRPILPRRSPPSCAATTTTARQLAARAKTRFPIGSPGWVKADDIISSKSATGARTLTPERTELHALPCTLGSRSRPHADARRVRRPRAEHLRRAARRDRKDHPRIPRPASRGAAGGDGRAGEEAGRRRGREESGRGQGQRRGDFQFAAPGRRPAIRRATSPSSSSSITTAATASAP